MKIKLIYISLFPVFIGFHTLSAQINLADSLRNAIQTAKDDAHRMHAMVLLADAIMPRQLDSAGKLLNSASQLRYSVNDIYKADFLNAFAVYQWYQGNLDGALQTLLPITQMKETPELLPKLARAYNNIGTLYNRGQMTDSAHKYLHEALRIDLERGNDYGVSKTYYDLSVMYFRRGHLELSLRYQLLSISAIEAQNDTLRLINGYNVLGNIYAQLNETEKAFDAYYKAVELDNLFERIDNLAMLYNNISSLYSNNPETFEKAIEYANKGIARLTPEKKPELMPLLLANIGGAYLSRKDARNALRYLHHSLSEVNPDQPVTEIGSILLNISRSHIMLENWDSARYYADLSLEYFIPAKALSQSSTAYFNKASADSAQGRFKAAHENYITGVALRDSTWNIDSRNRIAELQIIYDTEKKDAENRLLAEQNRLSKKAISNQKLLNLFVFIAVVLALLLLFLEHRMKRKIIRKNEEILRQKEELHQQSKRLAELNATRDKFFSIIAHDLRGPFSSLVGLLETLSEDYENMNDDERRYILDVLKQNSTSTLNLLINLLDWARAQTGLIENNPEVLNLHEKINQVFDILSGRAGEKRNKLINEVPENAFVFADPQLVQSILINLINNAIKFSPADGQTKVSATNTGDFFKVCVTDNGIGIPSDKLESIFHLDSKLKRQGTNKESGTGLGLIMVHEFLQLVGGTITIESQEGKGSTFCFTLPAAKM